MQPLAVALAGATLADAGEWSYRHPEQLSVRWAGQGIRLQGNCAHIISSKWGDLCGWGTAERGHEQGGSVQMPGWCQRGTTEDVRRCGHHLAGLPGFGGRHEYMES